MAEKILFSYGGGRQTVAMCIAIAKGVLPKPDLVVIADTGRENATTWSYMREYTKPLLNSLGLDIHVAPHSLATVDLYSGNGDLLLPVYTEDGKLPGFCSNEWKKRVVDRYLRTLRGTPHEMNGGIKWLGLALCEKRRWKKLRHSVEGGWRVECPLVDHMITTDACLEIIKAYGWPEPFESSCWFCPHKRNRQWRDIRDNSPDDWAKAVQYDREFRENDDQGGVFLHHSRVPLDEADLDAVESKRTERQCSLGMCFI